MIVAVSVPGPPDMPVTTPVVAFTVATAVLPLVHEPPVGLLPRVIVAPSATGVLPVIAPGSGFTVSTAVEIQPVPKVYVMVVVPPAMPVTKPVVVFIVPAAGLLLLHVPPPALFVRVPLVPTHSTSGPDMLPGSA